MSPQTRSQQGLSKESGAVGMGGEGGGGDRKGREREGGAKQGLKPRGSLSQDLRTSAQLSREWKTALRLGCLDLSLTPAPCEPERSSQAPPACRPLPAPPRGSAPAGRRGQPRAGPRQELRPGAQAGPGRERRGRGCFPKPGSAAPRPAPTCSSGHL